MELSAGTRAALAASAAVLAGLALALAGFIARSPFDWSFALRALLAFAAIASWLVHAAHRHDSPRFGPANAVTLARASLVAVLAAAIGQPAAAGAGWLWCALAWLALLGDIADGRIAKRFHCQSELGARFDMELDAVTVLVLAALAWQLDRAGAWVLIAGGARYVFVVAARAWPWLDAPLPPSFRRRAVCGVVVGTLATSLAPAIPASWTRTALALAVTALLVSFAIDTHLLRSARSERRARADAEEARRGRVVAE